ncbi:MAG: hypothetical protein ABL907_06675, partial [Hyphomicrobium sp.]
LLAVSALGFLGLVVTTWLQVAGSFAGNTRAIGDVMLLGCAGVFLTALLGLLYVYSTAFAYQALLAEKDRRDHEELVAAVRVCAADNPGLLESLRAQVSDPRIVNRRASA